MVMIPIYAIDRAAFNQGKNAQYDISIKEDGLMQTIVAKGPNAVGVPSEITLGELVAQIEQNFKASLQTGIRESRTKRATK